MSIEIRITIPDKSEGLDRFKDKLDHLDQMWRIVERRELEMTKDRFSSKTTPDGAAWKGNAPLTLMLAKGGSLMNRSGALKGSITAEGSGLRSVIEPHMIYAAIHQFGGTITPKKGQFLRIPLGGGKGKGKGKGKAKSGGKSGGAIFLKKVTIPAREYLGIGATDREMIEETVREWFAL